MGMKKAIEIIRTASPLGALRLEFSGGALTALRLTAETPENAGAEHSPEARLALRELEEYFAGIRREFSIPLAPRGTMFQQRVWAALRSIPYGEVRTYGEVAAMIGRPQAMRAVGGACHANPCLIITPCHRVVAAHGTGGFGSGLENKRRLLALETGDTAPFGFKW